MPWSKEADKWSQSSSLDPSDTDSAIQDRIKKIRDIISRPDPVPTSSNPPKTVNAAPAFEQDAGERDLTANDRVSLRAIQRDLKGWWKGNEEPIFLDRLARFKTKQGYELMDTEVYDFWIEEWSRKVREIAKLGK